MTPRRTADLAARISAASSRPTGGRPAQEQETALVTEAPVRITVDLTPDQHARLKAFTVARRTRGSVVVRTLLDLLEEDPTVLARVDERLRA